MAESPRSRRAAKPKPKPAEPEFEDDLASDNQSTSAEATPPTLSREEFERLRRILRRKYH